MVICTFCQPEASEPVDTQRLTLSSKLDEIRFEAYENSKFYKEKAKKFRDCLMAKKDFVVG